MTPVSATRRSTAWRGSARRLTWPVTGCGPRGSSARPAALLHAGGLHPEPGADRDCYDRHLAALRSALVGEVFQAEWAVGRAMTFDEAVAHALEPATV